MTSASGVMPSELHEVMVDARCSRGPRGCVREPIEISPGEHGIRTQTRPDLHAMRWHHGGTAISVRSSKAGLTCANG